MRFIATEVDGAFVVEFELHADERGHFARCFDAREFEERGMNPRVAQTSTSFTRRRGTIRGMHWQAAPAAEAKVVRCIRGAVWDVIADLRPDSPSFGRTAAVRLAADAPSSLYVPELCAHGFQTLADDTDVTYAISEFHAPEQARGFRFDDPAFAIEWPLPVTVVSERDRAWPGLPVSAAPRESFVR